MSWLALATKLIAPFEGCHKIGKDGLVYPYLDKLAKPPVWTRGYGNTNGIDANTPAITKAQAEQELSQLVQVYGNKVAALAPVLLQKPECLAACTSWAYNCGVGAFKASRLRRAINEGRWEDAAQFILKPDTAGGVVYRGLVRRREAERVLMILGSGASNG